MGASAQFVRRRLAAGAERLQPGAAWSGP